jgi:NitT/TauT family transport system ATP-binding protein
MARELIEEELVMRLPTESLDRLMETLINWGRYAELFGYSQDSDEFYLEEPEAPPAGPTGI